MTSAIRLEDGGMEDSADRTANPESEFTIPDPLPEPTSDRALRLRAKMGPERWEREVRQAFWKLHVVRTVERERRKGHGKRSKCLRQVAPDVHWSTYCHWRRCVGMRQGPEWERVLDGRVPPGAKPVPSEVKVAAVALRRANPVMRCSEAREHLVDQFGPAGRVSDATLHRTWRAHGVNNPEAGDPARFERVVEYAGGAALALVGAAAAESGVPEALARAALEAGKARAGEQDGKERPAADPFPGRESGRFTREYNEAVRDGVEDGQRDSRWAPDASKRERRDLSMLSVLSLAPETLGQRLLTMGMVPLVSNQRGYAGMDTPRGKWVRMLGWPAYRPSTLDKTLSELGVLGVDEALWSAHGELWVKKAREWAQGGPGWLQLVRYLDITAEPHWTRLYARSGKVSRTGRVQPCLQRAMMTVGPGVPIWMETVAGTHDLKGVVREWFEGERNGDESEEATIEWLTVVDAEAAVPSLLGMIRDLRRHRFVSVLKGSVLKGATVTEKGLWTPYRERDLLCEAEVVLAGGLTLRAVMMERAGSRNPHRTIFMTDASKEELSTSEVADVYLSRWANQESIFRRARHGAGMEHSHGFTGEFVTHVAVEKKLAEAERRVERREAELNKARTHEVDAQMLGIKAAEDEHFAPVAAEAARLAAKQAKEADRRYQSAVQVQKREQTMPREIFERDTTRENVATALTLSVMMLVEWVLREYMGGARMELETFLSYFLYLPVEVRTSWHKVRYRMAVDDLAPDKLELLIKACEEINRRRIKRAGRRLVFEVYRRLDEDD